MADVLLYALVWLLLLPLIASFVLVLVYWAMLDALAEVFRRLTKERKDGPKNER